MAKKMGIPLGMLCSGVNVNDITDRVIQTGAFHKSPAMLKTLSEAINIQIPYNFERLLFYLTDQKHELVQQWMTLVDATQRLDLPSDWLQRLQREFRSARVTDEAMCAIMRQFQNDYQYLADPHTAVALAAADVLGYLAPASAAATTTPVAILATASPCKFEEAVSTAVGRAGWDAYRQSTAYPAAAAGILERNERVPTLYRAVPGKTLEESQVEWEAMARDIVATLAHASA